MEFLQLDAKSWIGLVGAALVVGLTKAGFGAGAGILSVPLMLLVVSDPRDMLVVMLPLLICGDVFSFIHYPKQVDRRNLKLLVPSCVLGVFLGMFVLRALEQSGSDKAIRAAMLVLIGGMCLLFLAMQVWRYFRESRLTERPGPWRPKLVHGLGLGAAAGLTSTLGHVGGPLITLFLIPQKLDKRVFVGTSVAYFFFGNTVKIVPYAVLGYWTAPRFWTAAVLMPAVVAGTLIGVWLHRKFTGRGFVLFIYVCTLATLLKVIWDGVAQARASIGG